MKYLLKTVETYRVDNEAEAAQLIEEAKKDRKFTLAKSISEKKFAKAKGEIVDEWVRVTLTKAFTEEKAPDVKVEVEYEVGGIFPEPLIDDEEEEDE